MARYFIEVAYKGTSYSGFQIQENGITIQSEVEKALQTLHRHHIQLTGSSRTDAGVHAFQNYFHFDFEDSINPQIVYKLNAILPKNIAVRNLHSMSDKAHSRFDATSREYIYKIHTHKNPFLENASFYYPYKLDIGLLQEGASFIKTQNNFLGFSKTNTQVNNYRCEILHSQWSFEPRHLSYTIHANRFLRGMVRLVVGALLRLGRGQLSISEFQAFFSGEGRSGYSVPSQGLYLCRVNYPAGYFRGQEGFHSFLADMAGNDLE